MFYETPPIRIISEKDVTAGATVSGDLKP